MERATNDRQGSREKGEEAGTGMEIAADELRLRRRESVTVPEATSHSSAQKASAPAQPFVVATKSTAPQSTAPDWVSVPKKPAQRRSNDQRTAPSPPPPPRSRASFVASAYLQ